MSLIENMLDGLIILIRTVKPSSDARASDKRPAHEFRLSPLRRRQSAGLDARRQTRCWFGKIAMTMSVEIQTV